MLRSRDGLHALASVDVSRRATNATALPDGEAADGDPGSAFLGEGQTARIPLRGRLRGQGGPYRRERVLLVVSRNRIDDGLNKWQRYRLKDLEAYRKKK